MRTYELTTTQLNEGISLCVDNVTNLLETALSLASMKNNYALGLYIFAIEEFGKALLMKESYDKKNEKHEVRQDWFKGGEAHKEKLNKAVKYLPDSCKKIYAKIISIPYGPYKINIDKAKSIWQHEQNRVKLPKNLNGNILVVLLLDLRIRENSFYVGYDPADRRWKLGISPRSHELKASIKELQNIVSNYDWSLS